jgi:hypothetical protein
MKGVTPDRATKFMIRKIAAFSLMAGLLFLLTACPNGHKYEQGHFPYDPVNFVDVNSEYDDYNSTSPSIESNQYLYFSSNRNSNGQNFDIVGNNLRIFWDKDEGKLTIDTRFNDYKDYSYTDSLFGRMNTLFDEFGPYSLPSQVWDSNDYYYTDLIAFSNNESGNQDIKIVWFTGRGENPGPEDGSFNGPIPVSFLNTDSDDAYLTFYGDNFVIYDHYAYDLSSITDLLFCSNRNGTFDIFSAPVPSYMPLIDFLTGSNGTPVNPVSELNSNSDDKCPYACGHLLVFASNRPGGYGGYDLYYSQRNGDSWSEPVNFGERVNSQYDEYRPIVITNFEFTNDLMIFSSNRPGGKGGYDLYYVGIAKMTSYYL